MKYDLDLADTITIQPEELHRQQALSSPIWNALPDEVKRERLDTLAKAQIACQPASFDEIVRFLTPCLALVAPTGFSQADREEWLTAAAMTVAEVSPPADLLQRACASARLESDHPAKIVPLVIKGLEQGMIWRRKALRYAESDLLKALPKPKMAIEPQDVPPLTVDEIRAMPTQILHMGLKSGFITQAQYDEAFPS